MSVQGFDGRAEMGWQLPPGPDEDVRIVGKLLVEQTRSSIGTHNRRKVECTLRGLRLGKLNRQSVLDDTDSTRGMLHSVRHLIVWRPIRPRVSTDHVLRRLLDPDAGHADWAAAAVEASRALSLAREGIEMAADVPVQVREAQAISKALYSCVFSRDPNRGRQAAYALVANSDGFGRGLNRDARVQDLSKRDIQAFRDGLLGLFEALDVRYVSALSASRTSVFHEGEPVVEVTLTVARTLPFDIGGDEVMLRSEDLPETTGNDILIGCPDASHRLADHEEAHHGAARKRASLEVHALFSVPEDRLSSGHITVSVASPWLVENRRVRV